MWIGVLVWGGARIEEVGLRKKNGREGRALLSSAMWSLQIQGQSEVQKRIEQWGKEVMRPGIIRVVPAYTHHLAAVGFDRGHDGRV